MDEFSKLSLADPRPTVQDEDLEAILKLNISEQNDVQGHEKGQLPQQIINKFMAHVPSSPSPLRQAVFAEDNNDEMDIDLEEEIISQEVSNPSKAEENELLADSEGDDGISESEGSHLESPSSRAVIKALLSPTKLGIAAATKLDDLPHIPGNSLDENVTVPGPMPELSNSTSSEFTQESLETLRQRSRYSPIQISINNHHYYYPPEQSKHDERSHGNNSLKLPSPWSAYSRPVSCGSYIFTSYLQIFLNFLTALVCLSFVMIFMRALKADLRSEWRVKKMELDYESSKCEVQYKMNNCDRNTRVPALEARCDEWEKCMGRNNDLFFRARATLSARLIGDVLNSFIEPLGWKTLVVVFVGLAIWCFSSNFILGFARAKSYYGDGHTQTAQRRLANGGTNPTSNRLLQDSDQLEE